MADDVIIEEPLLSFFSCHGTRFMHTVVGVVGGNRKSNSNKTRSYNFMV